MPADIDDIRMDGKHANTSEQFVIDGRVDSVVVLREGKSAVAIRVIHADGYGKVPPSIALKGDPVGLKYGAVRLAIYHYAGSDRVLAHKRFRVGLLIIAGSCDSAADEVALAHKAQSAQVRDLLTAHDWSVSATVNGETQGEDIDLTGADQPVRTIDGAPVPRHILTVNGTDYAAQILGTANQ